MPEPQPIQIPGAPGWWRETSGHYSYATAASACPHCGDVGIPWRGWFSCMSGCGAIAVVADGRTFLPVPCPEGGRALLRWHGWLGVQAREQARLRWIAMVTLRLIGPADTDADPAAWQTIHRHLLNLKAASGREPPVPQEEMPLGR